MNETEAQKRLDEIKAIVAKRGYPTQSEWEEIFDCEKILIAAGTYKSNFYTED